MHKVLVDLHKLGGNKFNGLYHFCYQLGYHLAASAPPDMHLHLYVPKSQTGIFGNTVNYTVQNSVDKFYRFGTGQFDVWHVATTLSWYRPFNKRTKNLFTIHDLNFMEEEEYTEESKKKYLRLIRQRIDRADHLSFISEFSRKQAMQYADIDNKPYSIIYNGCNLPLLVSIPEPAYKPTRPFLFTIGQLHSRKNFHVLPALLVGNDYELVIAGLNNFPYTAKVIAEAKKHGVEDRIKLAGPVSEEEKYWYYQHCLAFVFPSTGEGFGMPVLEAMLFGKPVFLSTFTSLPEIGGDAAYYFTGFDPGEMRAVFEKGMNDYDSSDKATSIKERAALFSWTRAAGEYLDVYRKLMS